MKGVLFLLLFVSINGLSQKSNSLKNRKPISCDSSLTVVAFGTKITLCNPGYFQNAAAAFADAKRLLSKDSVETAFRIFFWVSFFDSTGIYGWRSNDIRDSLIRTYKVDLTTTLQGRWLLKWQGSNWGGREVMKTSYLYFRGETVSYYENEILQWQSRFKLKSEYELYYRYNVIHFLDVNESDLEIRFGYSPFYTDANRNADRKAVTFSEAYCACGCRTFVYEKIDDCLSPISFR